MIDLQTESALTLIAAAKLPQLRRNGRAPHVSQLYRWIQSGIRGNRLGSIVVGGTRCTTSEAVDRWIAALSGHGEVESSRTPVRRQRDHERAEKELITAGW